MTASFRFWGFRTLLYVALWLSFPKGTLASHGDEGAFRAPLQAIADIWPWVAPGFPAGAHNTVIAMGQSWAGPQLHRRAHRASCFFAARLCFVIFAMSLSASGLCTTIDPEIP